MFGSFEPAKRYILSFSEMTRAKLLLASPCQRLESSLSPAKNEKRTES
jgi:hypothetical protein